MNGPLRRSERLTERTAAMLHRAAWFRRVTGALRDRAAPDHWSLLFGRVAVSSFLVVAATGIFLLFFYEPSTAVVAYDGAYRPLRGSGMSRALASTLELSFEVPGGLLVRQLHSWSASLMIAALLLHILRIFFTGAFRRPRRSRWVLLFVVLFLSMGAGLTGAVLPDDLLSGSTLAVLDGVLKSIPWIGAWLSAVVFQGSFPSGAIPAFYPVHVVALPLLVAGAMILIGLLAARSRPEQFGIAGRGDTAAQPLRVMVGRTAALFLFVTAILTAMAAAVTVNPVWAYGPADPGSASSGGGAQWYVAFLDGAQRLVPPGWEFVWLGGIWTLAILVPVGLTGLYLLAAIAYPFLEAWITGDERDHHLLDRPRNAPTRTALGMAGVTVYGVLWAAAGSDVLAFQLGLGLEDLVLALQVALVLGPLTALLVTRRICLALQRRDRETVIAGFETGWVVRRPGGGYEGKRRALGARTRAELAGFSADAPLVLRPDADGRIRVGTRIRAVLSRWFFGDRVPPVERWEAETSAGPPAVSPVRASPPPS